MSFILSLWQKTQGWIGAVPWRAEIIRCLVMLVIAFAVMLRQDFGFTETPYNFF